MNNMFISTIVKNCEREKGCNYAYDWQPGNAVFLKCRLEVQIR